LWHYENQSFLESKISTLEKSVYEIHQTETKLAEVVKNVESQLEKHQKAIKCMVNDYKAAQASDTTRPVPSITEESVASIAASITAYVYGLKLTSITLDGLLNHSMMNLSISTPPSPLLTHSGTIFLTCYAYIV